MAQRSHRISKISHAASGRPSKRSKRRGGGDSIRTNSTPEEESSSSLLIKCFDRLKTGVWWRILPTEDEDEYDDVSVGIGINWEHLLPLLMDSGLLKVDKHNRTDSYVVSHDTWTTFILTSTLDLQKGSFAKCYIVNGKKKTVHQYFVCNGSPKFPNPSKQLKAIKKKIHAMPIEITHIGNLGRRVSTHGKKLLRAKYLYRVRTTSPPLGTTTTTATTATTDGMVDGTVVDVETKIAHALAINL